MGLLTGHELTWMSEALEILRDELPKIDTTAKAWITRLQPIAERKSW
jgi:hypothetical protein